MEVSDALRCALNRPHAEPQATRRNVFERGQDLNTLIGQEFAVQGVRFAGVEKCAPCEWMDAAVALLYSSAGHGGATG